MVKKGSLRRAAETAIMLMDRDTGLLGGGERGGGDQTQENVGEIREASRHTETWRLHVRDDGRSLVGREGPHIPLIILSYSGGGGNH
jgi:hypothetical protein